MKASFKSVSVSVLLVATVLTLMAGVRAQVGTTRYMSAIDPTTGAPIIVDLGARWQYWHELYPVYSQNHRLIGWYDNNGDSILSPSDQIVLVDPAGIEHWYHVDRVTVTIHWTWKEPPPPGQTTGEPTDGENEEDILYDDIPADPKGTRWHQIYPVYCEPFTITSYEDTNGDGKFSPSDQFDLTYDNPDLGGPWWAHLDAVSTDIIITEKDQPPLPEFPFALAIELALAGAVVYIWWTRRTKVPTS